MPTQTTQQVILPNEYQQTVGQSQQRQQLLQALALQLGKQPQGQVVGGVYTGGPNLGSALSQVLGTVLAGRSMDKQQELERDALQKYRTGEQEAIKNYAGSGAPTREAIIGAMTSPYSSLQGIAGKDYERLNAENTPFTRLISQATGLGGTAPDQSAQQQLQNIFPNLTMQEIVTGIAADPSGKTLYNASIERGKNVAVPDGATLMQPTGVGQAAPVRGVQQAQVSNAGAITAAKKRAEAAYDLAPAVETPEGTAYPTRLQMVQAANGGAPAGMQGAPVNLGAPQGQPSLGKIPPQVQAGRDQERMAILRDEYARTTNPADRAALEREMSRMTGGMSGSVPAPSGVPGVQVPYNTASKAADKGTRESDVKTFEVAREQAKSAASALNQIAQMRQSIKSGTFSGGYANLQERVAAFAGPLGIPIDQNRLSDTQYVKSTLQNLIVPQVKKLGVNPTDADAKRIEAMVGSITTDPGAFDKIMGLLEKSAKKDMDTFRRMDSHIRKNNSLAGFDYQLEQPGTSAENPMSLEDYLKSRSQ